MWEKATVSVNESEVVVADQNMYVEGEELKSKGRRITLRQRRAQEVSEVENKSDEESFLVERSWMGRGTRAGARW